MMEKHEEVVAIYPGSFDPITIGHLDVIERGSRRARLNLKINILLALPLIYPPRMNGESTRIIGCPQPKCSRQVRLHKSIARLTTFRSI